jgi:transcriptional regulator with XRE-family HTH domain
MAIKYRFDGPGLKRRIRASGKPHELIALKVGRRAGTLLGYESGRIAPSLDIARALAAELGCPMEDLFTPAVDDLPKVAARARVKSRKAQGLPSKVTDPAALDEAAELLRPTGTGPARSPPAGRAKE